MSFFGREGFIGLGVRVLNNYYYGDFGDKAKNTCENVCIVDIAYVEKELILVQNKGGYFNIKDFTTKK